MYLKSLILVGLLLLSASGFTFALKLDSNEHTKETCRSQIKKKANGKTHRQSLKGCCSHHKGISQCGLDKIVTFKDGHLKCVDGWKSGCEL